MIDKVNFVIPSFSPFLNHFTLNPIVQAVKFMPQKTVCWKKKPKTKNWKVRRFVAAGIVQLIFTGDFAEFIGQINK